MAVPAFPAAPAVAVRHAPMAAPLYHTAEIVDQEEFEWVMFREWVLSERLYQPKDALWRFAYETALQKAQVKRRAWFALPGAHLLLPPPLGTSLWLRDPDTPHTTYPLYPKPNKQQPVL